jgi:hypothetical protein
MKQQDLFEQSAPAPQPPPAPKKHSATKGADIEQQEQIAAFVLQIEAIGRSLATSMEVARKKYGYVLFKQGLAVAVGAVLLPQDRADFTGEMECWEDSSDFLVSQCEDYQRAIRNAKLSSEMDAGLHVTYLKPDRDTLVAPKKGRGRKK